MSLTEKQRRDVERIREHPKDTFGALGLLVAAERYLSPDEDDLRAIKAARTAVEVAKATG